MAALRRSRECDQSLAFSVAKFNDFPESNLPMLRLLGIIGTVLLIGGCDKRPAASSAVPDNRPAAAVAESSSTPPKSPAPEIGRQETGPPSNAGLLSAASPTATASGDVIPDQAWQSEQWNEQIELILRTLGTRIVKRPADDQPLPQTDPAVQSTAIFPDNLVVVYRDEATTVTRGRVDKSRVHVGQAFLLEQLRKLAPQQFDADGSYAKFKVVSIEPEDSGFASRVLCQFRFVGSETIEQTTSHWKCRWELSDAHPQLHAITVDDVERATTRRDSQFADVTGSVVIRESEVFTQIAPSLDYWLDRLQTPFSIMAGAYQGIAVADVNGDGLEDVYLPQPGGVLAGLPNRLLLQQPDGTVRDASAESGLDWLIETHAALFVDLDNDGDQDVAVATVMGIVLAENDGAGRFTRRVTRLTPDAPPMSLVAADPDHDGHLDLYACCYAPRTSAPLTGRPIPYHDANNGGRNVFLRNDGQWRFRDATRRVGLDQNNRRFSFAAAWEDVDNDGDIDLYVANDYGRNNLYLNESGRFRDVADTWGAEDISAGMSVTWGDYDHDGWMDLYVSNMWSSAGHRIAFQRRFQPNANDHVLSQFRRHARGNSLFRNLGSSGDGFEDVSLQENVNMGRWAWSSLFADLNNDGHEDLLVANGFITQEKADDL